MHNSAGPAHSEGWTAFCHRKRRQSWSMTIMARTRHHFVARFEFLCCSASNFTKIQCVCVCVFKHTGFFGKDKCSHSTREPAKNAGNIQTNQMCRTQCTRLRNGLKSLHHTGRSFWCAHPYGSWILTPNCAWWSDLPQPRSSSSGWVQMSDLPYPSVGFLGRLACAPTTAKIG